MAMVNTVGSARSKGSRRDRGSQERVPLRSKGIGSRPGAKGPGGIGSRSGAKDPGGIEGPAPAETAM